jgi:hypothetical protein
MNTDALTKMVSRAYNLGVFDDLVAIELEYRVSSCFEDMNKIRELAAVEGALSVHWTEDFVGCVQFVNAALVVLRWYTTGDYEAEQKKVNEQEDWIKFTIYGDITYA